MHTILQKSWDMLIFYRKKPFSVKRDFAIIMISSALEFAEDEKQQCAKIVRVKLPYIAQKLLFLNAKISSGVVFQEYGKEQIVYVDEARILI
jgi:hypothetical protein